MNIKRAVLLVSIFFTAIQSAYGKYDLSIALHIDPPLKAYNVVNFERKVVEQIELFNKAKEVFDEEFSIVEK